MPTDPAPMPTSLKTATIQFVKRVGLILGAALGAAAVAALALGQFNPFGISNMLFWAALIVLALAVFPAIAELGAGFSNMGKSFASREKAAPVPMERRLEESHARRDKWLNNSLTYGLAGICVFVLSLLFATLFSPR